MKKFLILIILFTLCTVSASARVRSITEWNDPTAGGRIESFEDEQISCAEKCPGYDITTTYCYNYGEELESCPEDGCGYYHRCVPAK